MFEEAQATVAMGWSIGNTHAGFDTQASPQRALPCLNHCIYIPFVFPTLFSSSFPQSHELFQAIRAHFVRPLAHS